MDVLCRHNNLTAPIRNFTTKVPGVGKVVVSLVRGALVTVDEGIALRYPNIFSILPAPSAKDEEVKPDPIDATDEPEKVEPEPTEEREIVFEAPEPDGEKPFAVDLVEEVVKCEETEKSGEDNIEDEDTTPVDADAAKRDLIDAIDDFKTKKKLLDYAKSCKVELDSSIKLKDMKQNLKVMWDLV